jgi:four helix bundle protein
MEKIQNPKRYDLEERTIKFFKDTIQLCRILRKDAINVELIKQLIRSAGSVGANYREANEALSKKDFSLRIRISRKEAKESHFWLQAVLEANTNLAARINPLIQESLELTRIFTSIENKAR